MCQICSSLCVFVINKNNNESDANPIRDAAYFDIFFIIFHLSATNRQTEKMIYQIFIQNTFAKVFSWFYGPFYGLCKVTFLILWDHGSHVGLVWK